jgi:hypothetical protein
LERTSRKLKFRKKKKKRQADWLLRLNLRWMILSRFFRPKTSRIFRLSPVRESSLTLSAKSEECLKRVICYPLITTSIFYSDYFMTMQFMI